MNEGTEMAAGDAHVEPAGGQVPVRSVSVERRDSTTDPWVLVDSLTGLLIPHQITVTTWGGSVTTTVSGFPTKAAAVDYLGVLAGRVLPTDADECPVCGADKVHAVPLGGWA